MNQTKTDNQTASVTPEVYASQDVPGNFGFIGCESDQYETRESAEQAARQTAASVPETPRNQDSKDIALRALINRAEHLIKEMEFAFDDVPAGVDAHIAMTRLAIADARQQL